MIELDITDKKPVCPECGNVVIFTTLVGYIGKDLKDMWCEKCGYSEKAYLWKAYIKKEV
jgi:ribosomal protein S27AE